MTTRSDYLREWRRTPAGRAYLAAQKRLEKAKRRAYVELAERHVAEYNRLLDAHLQQLADEEKVG